MEEDKDSLPPPTGVSRAAVWIAALSVLLLPALASIALASGPHRRYDLPAGEAATTLNEFGHQSDLQVLFDFNSLKGVQTRAVKAELDASEALARMLAGTGLAFEFVNEHTLAVTPRAKKAAAVRELRERLAAHPEQALHAAEELEQVLVSGTLENGSQPLLGAQLIQFTRTDIDRSGLATAQDFLHTLPQVFGGGPNENTVLGREAATNSARGSGINLRGLDAGATLILIDGKRLPPSGTEGVFQDVSNIPLSIVDHVDVMPDGSSARYGADAIGGVVNFVTRQNYTGAESQLRAGAVTDGSRGQQQFSQLLGHAWESGSVFAGLEYYRQDDLPARDRWQQRSNLTPYGGDNFNSYYGSPGTLVAGLFATPAYYPLPRGQNGTALDGAALVPGPPNLYDINQGTDITPDERRLSLFGKSSLELGEDLDVYASGLLTRRDVRVTPAAGQNLELIVPATNPFYVNPLGGTDPVAVLYGGGTDFGPLLTTNRIYTGNFTLGLTRSTSRDWTFSGYGALAFESQHEIQHGQVNQDALDAALADPNPATAFNPFGDGPHTNPATIASIAGVVNYRLQSMLKTVSATAIGPLFNIRGGAVEATLGAEYRDQTLGTELLYPTPELNAAPRDDLGRRIGAAFAELRVPLIGTANQARFARRLEISLGVRGEHYSDIGSAGIPKLGLDFSPGANLNLRGTWTRSFRAPGLPDLLARNNYSTLITLPDAASPTGSSVVLARYGTNPELSAERARSWTFGADLTPERLPGLSVSLTYFDVNYTERIDEPQISADVLQQPQNAWLVERNFTPAELQDACVNSVYVGAPGSCLSTPVVAILDTRLRNIQSVHTDGMDLIGKYALPSSVGHFDFGLNGTWLFRYAQTNTPGSAALNILSTQNNPIDLRLRANAAWLLREFSAAAFVNYADHYRDTLSVPGRGIASWTTVDLQLGYETDPQRGDWLGRLQFTLNIQNLMDRDAPFLNNPVGVGYDQENADLYGRAVSLEVRKRW